MATASVLRIMANSRVHLPGAVDTAIQYELFNVLDEFLRESDVWREVIDFTAEADEDEYDIIPSGGVLAHLISVKTTDVESPVAATMSEPGLLILATAPSSDTEMLAELSLTVVDPVTSAGYPYCPDWILTRYHAAITSGLISKMMLQVAKPYTNEKMAVFHGRKFRNGLATARKDVAHQNLRGAQAWRYPAFA